MDTRYTALLQSAQTTGNPFMPTAELPLWLEERRKACGLEVERIPFGKLENWSFEASTGNLTHATGRFFRIEGIWVETNYGGTGQWSQPIINQPEVGVLGIITKRFGNTLYFLMQAKMEPGNINAVQLSPTLQATRSNFTRAHRGQAPPYLEYFLNGLRVKPLVDILQSEQGARFYRKRNRNIIIEVTDDIPVLDNYCWLTLGQIHKFAGQDNMMNMDARTVVSCVPFFAQGLTPQPALPRLAAVQAADDGARPEFKAHSLSSLMDSDYSMHSLEDILGWFTQLKFRYDLNVERIPLKYVQHWVRSEDRIYHEDEKYFSVIAVRVRAEGREVPYWTQPMVRPREQGILAFVVRRFEGVWHFLVQAKVEPGNFDVVEMAPTVQCLTGSYSSTPPEARPAFLEYVLNAAPELRRLSTLQSEEGGRFFHEVNRNLIIEADASFPDEIPYGYIWMTLSQLRTLIQYNNFVNVQARCLLAGLGSLWQAE